MDCLDGRSFALPTVEGVLCGPRDVVYAVFMQTWVVDELAGGEGGGASAG